MAAEEKLHRLVDELPESEVLAAERYLEYLSLARRDPFVQALIDAPLDDEPEWRLRVGEWRVRFAYDYAARTIYVLRVLPRGRAYRD